MGRWIRAGRAGRDVEARAMQAVLGQYQAVPGMNRSYQEAVYRALIPVVFWVVVLVVIMIF